MVFASCSIEGLELYFQKSRVGYWGVSPGSLQYSKPVETSWTMEKPARDQTLQRSIGPLGLMFTALTGIIGSGWLFASLYAAQIAGPAAVFSWMVGGFIAIALTLTYAELGGMLPVAGAIARIPHFSHGSINSFLAGWLCWIAYVATAPIEVTAVLQYSSNYLPWLTVKAQGEQVLSYHGLIVAAALMLLFTIVNLFGVQWLTRANTTITYWKLAVPLAVALILIAKGFRSENFFEAGGFAPNGIAGVFGAVSNGGVMFSLFGFRIALDMAGEAKTPHRDIPLAMIGAMGICVVLYLLLQVAFIGVIPPSHLKHGWHGISETTPGGPFAGFAAMLGLTWIAFALYIDAVISPSGTGLASTAATSRINYGMAKNGQFPAVFKRVNRFQVPAWSLVFNFLVGMVIFLPFPGWAELVGFISSAVVLSLAFGPVSLAALRLQLPNVKRPFRVPYATAYSALCFVLVGYVVYWTGWDTNWKVLLSALIGLVFLALGRAQRRTQEPLNLKASGWIWPYLAGIGLISYTGQYGHGLGMLTHGMDMLILTLFSLGIFALALKLRLPAEHAERLLADDEEMDGLLTKEDSKP
jgi:amino acid transporter